MSYAPNDYLSVRDLTVLLYKFTTSLDIAKQISVSIFRFYELVKYIKIEDNAGRSDINECSITFPEEASVARMKRSGIRETIT